MIAEAYRFAPARAYVKELLEQGYIGSLQTLSISLFLGPRQRPEPAGPRLHWRSSNQTGGGFSAGPASTFFDAVLDWFGDVVAVRGKVYQAHPGAAQPDGSPADADESLTANFELANGAWGSFTASATAPFGQGALFDIMGSEGSLRLTQVGLLPLSTDALYGGRFDDGPEIQQLQIPERLRETVSEDSPKIEAYHPYQAVVRAFADGMTSGRSPRPNFDDAYKLQRITDAIRESSAGGGWVSI
jgi:predicted dehydrogenase